MTTNSKEQIASKTLTSNNNIELPGKLQSEQKFRNVNGNVDLILNAYPLDLGKMVKAVFQYKLTFVAYRTCKDKNGNEKIISIDLNKSKGNDEAKITNQQVHWALFQQLMTANTDFFGDDPRCFVYDCSQMLFSVAQLPLDLKSEETSHREFLVELRDEQLSERCRAYIRSVEKFKAFIEYTRYVDITDVQGMMERGERDIVHFLELLSSQRMHQKGAHYMFGNCMYTQKEVKLQGDARVMHEGMQKNVRFVGNDVKAAQPIVQLDSKKSAFFPDQRLHHFLADFLNCQDGRELEKQLRRDQERAKAEKQIRGLAVRTNYLPETQKIFTIVGLTKEAADRIRFQYEDKEITVCEYFEKVYKQRLHYPGLLCAVQKTKRGDCYYPMEMIKILPGQRVPLEKQTPGLTQAMIRQCQILPSQLSGEIEKQREHAMLQNANPFFKSHNVRIDTQLMHVRGERLYPPAIQYANDDRVEPRNDGSMDWKMTQNRRFIKPAIFPSNFVVTIVQHCARENDCKDFCRQLLRSANNRGIVDADFGRIAWEPNFKGADLAEEKFRQWQSGGVKFVLFFAEGKDNAFAGDIHHVFKLMETQFGITTLHISPKILAKWRSGRGSFMVIDNILLKLNEKLGGINWALSTPLEFMNDNKSSHDIIANEWLGNRRMFIGIDMSHPPPQTRFERRVGVPPANPTVVGMSYTVGQKSSLLKMRGLYWFQRARLVTVRQPEDVRPMVDAVKKAMGDYFAENGHYPEHLIVFRGGVSEGEFQLVANWEGRAFGQALKELHVENREVLPKPPRLTIVVCQRHSNYRIVPARMDPYAKAPQQNVQPGTVMDREVMSPVLTEFLLVAHRALQGTAQPVRCTVVLDREPRIPLEELRYVTYHLCYGNGNCTLPTALPAPLFSAGELAKRGRNNLRTDADTLNIDIDTVQIVDDPSASQEDLFNKRIQVAENKKLVDLTKRLQTDISTKFWA